MSPGLLPRRHHTARLMTIDLALGWASQDFGLLFNLLEQGHEQRLVSRLTSLDCRDDEPCVMILCRSHFEASSADELADTLNILSLRS